LIYLFSHSFIDRIQRNITEETHGETNKTTVWNKWPIWDEIR